MDTNLVEINEEMNELLDKQVWQAYTKLSIGLTVSPRKVCDENKENDDCPSKKEDFLRLCNENGENDRIITTERDPI